MFVVLSAVVQPSCLCVPLCSSGSSYMRGCYAEDFEEFGGGDVVGGADTDEARSFQDR